MQLKNSCRLVGCADKSVLQPVEGDVSAIEKEDLLRQEEAQRKAIEEMQEAMAMDVEEAALAGTQPQAEGTQTQGGEAMVVVDGATNGE
jgi:hypothetical protein